VGDVITGTVNHLKDVMDAVKIYVKTATANVESVNQAIVRNVDAVIRYMFNDAKLTLI
jgi:hypothetical protein